MSDRSAGAIPVFGYGFRPFFLLAGVFSTLMVPASLAVYLGWMTAPTAWPAGLWHAHEMLLGYAVAAVAGFLLTAVPGWHKTAPVAGGRLAALVALWLAGRVAMWFADAGAGGIVAAIDLAFLPVLALVGVPSLFTARARKNAVFVVLLALLVAANASMHAAAAGRVESARATALAVDTLALFIAVLGGRIVPGFTANALAGKGLREAVRRVPALDRVAVAAVAAVVVLDVVRLGWDVPPALAAALAFAAAAANGIRLARWGGQHTLDQPIVWVLHLGFAWLVAGFALAGLAELAVIERTAAVHGLAVGAVGTMTLAVMSRAAMGHTGRPIVAPAPAVAAYLLVSVAAVARIAAACPAVFVEALVVAAAAWTFAFAAFTWAFAPMLVTARPDRRPG